MTTRITVTPGMPKTRARGIRDSARCPGASGTSVRASTAVSIANTLSTPKEKRQSKVVPSQEPKGVPTASPRGVPMEAMARARPANSGAVMRAGVPGEHPPGQAGEGARCEPGPQGEHNVRREGRDGVREQETEDADDEHGLAPHAAGECDGGDREDHGTQCVGADKLPRRAFGDVQSPGDLRQQPGGHGLGGDEDESHESHDQQCRQRQVPRRDWMRARCARCPLPAALGMLNGRHRRIVRSCRIGF